MRLILYYIFAFIIVDLFVSCHHRSISTETSYEDSIIVFYYRGIEFETSASIPCDETKKRFLSFEVDKTKAYEVMVEEKKVISSTIYKRIKNLIDSLQYKSNHSICDTRIFVKADSIGFCIGPSWSNCLCSSTNSDFENNLLLAYLIKWKSGYYNYFSEEILKEDIGVRYYGLPFDYHYTNRYSFMKGQGTMPPFRTISKVIIYPDSVNLSQL